MVTIHTTESMHTIPKEKSAKDEDVNCGYSIWINVTHMSVGTNPRTIFKKDDIHMELDSTNKLLLKVNKGSLELASSITEVDSIFIPIQKWVNIIISFESNYLTVFIDGKMVASKILEGWRSKNSETEIGGEMSFKGEIANFKFFNDYLTVADAWEIYKEGYGSGFFSGLANKYKLKVAFLKDNSEVTSFQL
tara:strand:- start:4224 stop:4799 length:576 start_codon:yes stop_codon:yes gene_type:complete